MVRPGWGAGWVDLPHSHGPPTPVSTSAPQRRHLGLAAGKPRHGGGCLSPLQRFRPRWGLSSSAIPSRSSSREAGPQAAGAMGLLRCPHSVFRDPTPPPPDGDLPMGARTSQLPPRVGRVGCPQLRAAFHPGPGSSSLSVTCCPPGRGPREPRARPVCETWPLCPHVLGWRGWRGARDGPWVPKQHPAPRAPHSQLLTSGWAQLGWSLAKPRVQRWWLHAKPSAVVSGKGRSWGAGGERVLLEHAWSAACASTCVCAQSVGVRVYLRGYTHTHISAYVHFRASVACL